MSYSIGDGMANLGLAGVIVAYIYLRHKNYLKQLEIVHQERMAAMEKGIPLPEFPFEKMKKEARPAEQLVIPILGMVLSTLSLGAMIVIFCLGSSPMKGYWITPLPFMFLGIGFLAYHFMMADAKQ